MQIKYLKDAPLGKVGDVADVADDQAQILITLGYAKEHPSKEAKARTKSDKADTQTDLLTPEPTTDE